MLNGRCSCVDPCDPAAFACLRPAGHTGPHQAGSAQWVDDYAQRASLIGAAKADELDKALRTFFRSICRLTGREWVDLSAGQHQYALSRARRGDINDALPERTATLVNELVAARRRAS